MTQGTLVKNEATPQYVVAEAVESAMLVGDLSKLTAEQRVSYYKKVCDSMGLNPLTRPFDYINLNGKLTLYAKRDAADQLRKRDGISVTIQSRETIGDVYVVTAHAQTPDGRTDESIGAVNTKGLTGDALANALMKAETKSKRRVTLSICGLGWLDETEVETVPAAQVVEVAENGEVKTAHWIDDDHNRKAFWSAVTKRGLSDVEMHKLMGLSTIRDWQGTAAELLKAIDAKIGEQTK